MGRASIVINRKMKFVKTNIVISAVRVYHAICAAVRRFGGSDYDDVGMRVERELQDEQEVDVLRVLLAA